MAMLEYLVEQYKKFYPDYTLESLTQTMKIVIDRHGQLDAIIVDYYMRSIDAGGLGYGVRNERYN